MKIEQQRRKLGSDYTEILDYQIEASSKAFEILFKNIYSDPIRAVLRELGTNAYDSHVEAGRKDYPFDIHLPNSLDPTFSIRDYGVGLDGEEIRNVYRVVFKSTKTHSNEQIGCFGLGCKTPFAYTDNYIIESYKGGKKWICNAFYGDTAKPSLAFTVDGEPTKEPDGLKVVIICKNDYLTWAQKTKEVYRFFKAQPKISGQTVVFDKVKYVIEGKDWALRSYETDPYSYYNKHQGIIAIMGQIPYRIEVNSIANLTPEQKKIATCGIDITFNIGDLSVEANREGIHLNDRSCNAIRNKLTAIYDELGKKITDSVKDAPTYWDACVKLNNTEDAIFNLASVVDVNKITYKGEKLLRQFYLPEELGKKILVYGVATNTKRAKLHRRGMLHFSDTVFFFKDAEAAESRLKQYSIDHPDHRNLILLENLDNGLNEKTTGFEDLLKCLGLPEDRVIKLSTLPKLPPVKRTYNRAKTSKVNLLKNNRWEDAEIDLEDGQGFYVEMYQQHTVYKMRNKLSKLDPPIDDPVVDKVMRPRTSTRRLQLADLIKLQRNMEKLGFPVYNIYGIRTSHLKKLGPRWKCFYKYAESKLNYILDLHQYEVIEKPRVNDSFIGKHLKELSKRVDKTTPVYKLKEIIDSSKSVRPVQLEFLNSYCHFFDKQPVVKKTSRQQEVDDIINKYYLLSKIPAWTVYSSELELMMSSAADYINRLGDKV